MTQCAYILKSPGEPDEVFTDVRIMCEYLTARCAVFAITGNKLILQRVLTNGTVVATIEKVRLNLLSQGLSHGDLPDNTHPSTNTPQ